MVVPKCWRVGCNPSMIIEPSSGGNVSSSEFQAVFSATAGRGVHEK